MTFRSDRSFSNLHDELTLGGVLARLRDAGGYDLVAHHTQGEFHHDVIVRALGWESLGPAAPVVVVATNCNGGVKELLAFDDVPERYALWHYRCPTVREFGGELPPLRAAVRTVHWFDPCELLREDARSELLPEHRERDVGGGYRAKACGSRKE